MTALGPVEEVGVLKKFGVIARVWITRLAVVIPLLLVWVYSLSPAWAANVIDNLPPGIWYEAPNSALRSVAYQ